MLAPVNRFVALAEPSGTRLTVLESWTQKKLNEVTSNDLKELTQTRRFDFCRIVPDRSHDHESDQAQNMVTSMICDPKNDWCWAFASWPQSTASMHWQSPVAPA